MCRNFNASDWHGSEGTDERLPVAYPNPLHFSFFEAMTRLGHRLRVKFPRGGAERFGYHAGGDTGFPGRAYRRSQPSDSVLDLPLRSSPVGVLDRNLASLQ